LKTSRSEDLAKFLASLRPIHELYKSLAPSLTLHSAFANDEYRRIIELVRAGPQNIGEDNSRSSYEGFVEIGDDLYAKITNPYFRMNKISLESFLSCKKSAGLSA
jgi:hypothetical protein